MDELDQALVGGKERSLILFFMCKKIMVAVQSF